MARKAKAKRKAGRPSRPAPRRKTAPKTGKTRAGKPADALDTFVVAAAGALNVPLAAEWLPAIKANLAVTLRLAERFASFDLPDEAEPAPVFRA